MNAPLNVMDKTDRRFLKNMIRVQASQTFQRPKKSLKDKTGLAPKPNGKASPLLDFYRDLDDLLLLQGGLEKALTKKRPRTVQGIFKTTRKALEPSYELFESHRIRFLSRMRENLNTDA